MYAQSTTAQAVVPIAPTGFNSLPSRSSNRAIKINNSDYSELMYSQVAASSSTATEPNTWAAHASTSAEQHGILYNDNNFAFQTLIDGELFWQLNVHGISILRKQADGFLQTRGLIDLYELSKDNNLFGANPFMDGFVSQMKDQNWYVVNTEGH